jgi:MFS family permease
MPALVPALAAMTALQGVVALALFAPGVLAPALGLQAFDIALYTTGCFVVAMAGALWGGGLVGRFGSFGVAVICMMATIMAMAIAAIGSPVALLAAGLVLGLAFGPETPASSALLGQLATARQRPLIFSVRQTGNQFGAIIGSLTLPWLVLLHPQGGYGAVAAIAAIGAVAFFALRRRYDGLTRKEGAATDPRAAWALLSSDAAVRRLALISMPLSAMQLGLNAYLVTYLTGTFEWSHVAAGAALGVAQAGGLAGRLGWGAVAARIGASLPVIAGLGVGTAVIGLAIALMPPGTTWPPLAMLAFLFGLTASGWNGVFLSEVARTAPDGRVAEATGAVLTASYGGLVAGPVLITALASLGGLRLAYAALAIACLMGAIWLMRKP